MCYGVSCRALTVAVFLMVAGAGCWTAPRETAKRLPPPGKSAPTVRYEEGLTLLNLRDQRLLSLPREVLAVKTAKELYLDKNEGMVIGEELVQMGGVQRLSLEGCRLVSFPVAICRLPALSVLSLDDNMLSSLPDEIGSLPALKVLTLGRNRLSDLPGSIGLLSSLEVLHADDNLLRDLPVSISGMVSLKTLSLDRNRISTIPESLCELRGLQSLSLAGNRLTRLPDAMGNLASLRVLTLNGNLLPRAEMLRIRKALPNTMIVE